MATWCTIWSCYVHLFVFISGNCINKYVSFSVSRVCNTMAAQRRDVVDFIGQATVSLLLEEFHAEVCPVIPVVIKYQVTFTPLLHHTFAGLRRRGRHRRACSCCAAVDASSTLPAAMHHSRVSSWQSFE